MNQCIHGIDLLRWMMGDDVEEVYGYGTARVLIYDEPKIRKQSQWQSQLQ